MTNDQNIENLVVPNADQITPEMEAQAEAWDNAMQRAFKGIYTRKERRRGMIRATKRQMAQA